MITAGAVVIGLIIANVTPGILGHLIALLVWAGAAWSCVRPARARTASAARTWARIGVAACACLAVYAASLAVVGTAGNVGHTAGSSAIGSDAARFCKLEVTWTTGASMTIAESLDTALSSCDDLASELTQRSQGYFTAVSGGKLASIPPGICTDDGVTLLSAPTTAVVACDGLEQNINYLLAP